MNLLTESLPDTVNVNGRDFEIDTRATAWIQFELLMQDESISQTEKCETLLTPGAWYIDEIPDNIASAIQALTAFYSSPMFRPEKEAETAEEQKRRELQAKLNQSQSARSYDFAIDNRLIVSAFREVYNIDIEEMQNLHWFTFRSYFDSLPDTCKFEKIKEIRLTDTSQLKGDEKKRIERLQKLYFIGSIEDENAKANAAKLEDRNRKMREYIAIRYQQAFGGKN